MSQMKILVCGETQPPAAVQLFGRANDMQVLTSGLRASARILAVTGAGGLGKSTLARKWAESQGDQFEVAIWCSFKDRPSLAGIFYDIRQRLSVNEMIPAGESIHAHLDGLIDILSRRKVLLIFDNLETLMLTGDRTGYLDEDYYLLGILLTQLSESPGSGVCLVTSREELELLSELDGGTHRICLCPLSGLTTEATGEFLSQRSIEGSAEDLKAFTVHHDGNPYAMRFAAVYIKRNHLTDGLRGYIAAGLPLPSPVTKLVRSQFERLSDLQQICVLRLAAERVALTRKELIDSLSFRWLASEIAGAIEGIAGRSLFEPPSADGSLSLQNLLVEFATEHLVHRFAEDLANVGRVGFSNLLTAIPVLRARVPQHVRTAQINAIASPIKNRLDMTTAGGQTIADAMLDVLKKAKGRPASEVGHAPGSVVNLLAMLKFDFSGHDFSDLVLWDCGLEEVELRDTTLRDSDLTGCTFSDVFGAVTGTCFSADGSHLLAVTSDGTLRDWDLATWEQTVVRAHKGYARAIAVDTARERVVTVGRDGRVRAWRVSPLEHDEDIAQVKPELRCIAISPSGRFAVWGGGGGHVEACWFGTSRRRAVLKGHRKTVRGVTFLDDETVVSVDEAGEVLKWVPEHSEKPVASHVVNGPAWWVSYDRSAAIMAVGGQRLAAVLLNDELDEQEPVLEFAGSPSWAGVFVGDEILLATSSGAVVSYSLHDGERTRTSPLHLNWARTIAAHPSLPIVASGGEDQTVRILNYASGSLLRTVRGSTRSFWSVSFSHDGSMLAAGGNNRIVYIWQKGMEVPRRLEGYPGWIRTLTFAPGKRLLAVAGDSGQIFLWDLEQDAHEARAVGAHNGPVWSLHFDPSGKYLASAGEDHLVRVWEVGAVGSAVGRRLHQHDSWVVSTRYSRDGRHLASGDDDGVLIVTTSFGTEERALRDRNAQQNWGLAWAPGSGQILFSAGRDGALRKWAIDRHAPLAVVNCGRQLWSCVCSSNATGSVYVAGDAGVVSEYSIAELTKLRERETGSARLHALTLHDLSGRLAAAGDDGVVTVWDSKSDKPNRLVPDRQYERLDLFGVRGLTDAQQVVLRTLGATFGERTGSSNTRGQRSVMDGSTPPARRAAIGQREGDPGTSSGNRRPITLLVLLAVLLVLVALFFLIYFG
jgi:WD40 repeat protein